tara:strand:+ start:331 stop:468 length:138 start_codon:yes stop_codon:yes gene_type:complete
MILIKKSNNKNIRYGVYLGMPYIIILPKKAIVGASFFRINKENYD